jgi:hypothetical protein
VASSDSPPPVSHARYCWLNWLIVAGWYGVQVACWAMGAIALSPSFVLWMGKVSWRRVCEWWEAVPVIDDGDGSDSSSRE